jgi:hypothetical protein
MTSYGFQSSVGEERGTAKTTFTRSLEGVLHEVIVSGPTRWVGGKEAACGIRLSWKITDETASAAPTLTQLLKELPQLKDSRLEAKVYTTLGDWVVDRLSVGGTWSKYYTWDALFQDPRGDLTLGLEKLLKDLAFHKEEDSYCRDSTVSYAWITPLEKEKQVEFRIQPDSN